jgi:cytochrome c peroxidase
MNTKAMKVLCLIGVIVSLLVPTQSLFSASDDDALLGQAKQFFSPLPEQMQSEQNPLTPEKVALGKILFYETRVSADGTVSCARCHPFGLYAADGLKKSIGNGSKVNPRNAPTILNAAAQISAHWIGNRTGVEDQAKLTITGPPSFGMPSYATAEKRLREIKGYGPLFKKAFPGNREPVTIDNFALAIGAFERTLTTPSPFDAFMQGDKTGLSDAGKTGLKRFMDTGCMACHAGAYFGGQMYQKFGALASYWQYTGSADIDEGRYAVTKNENDKYVFKVPILRNVEMTSPYFHDGSVDRLQDAVRIMGKIQLGKDLSSQEISEIVTFLKSLTGRIPDDVLKLPLLPPSE